MRPQEQELDTLLTVQDVAEILSVGVRTVWRWTALSRLPKPIRLAKKVVRWKASELQAYLDNQPLGT
jgi:predicted DNA-binding transcriptional regulator AlpA